MFAQKYVLSNNYIAIYSDPVKQAQVKYFCSLDFKLENGGLFVLLI